MLGMSDALESLIVLEYMVKRDKKCKSGDLEIKI